MKIPPEIAAVILIIVTLITALAIAVFAFGLLEVFTAR